MTWPQIDVVLAHKDLPRVPRCAELVAGAGVPGANVGGKVGVVNAGPLGGVDVVGKFFTRAPLGEHSPSEFILYLNWPFQHAQGLAPDTALA